MGEQTHTEAQGIGDQKCLEKQEFVIENLVLRPDSVTLVETRISSNFNG